MHIDTGSTALMAAAVASQQAQMQTAIQLEIVKTVAENQQAMVEMLTDQSLGLQVDVKA
jgi:hypothetical protein